ncbi:MAG: creatininase family protein [Breznakia sp.]
MYKVSEFNSSNIRKAYKNAKNVILPIGAIEAHGAHLPLATDNIIAEKYCTMLAEKTNSLLLPLLPYGQVWSLEKAPGSISINESTLVQFIVDIIRSLEKDSVSMLTLITTHFGNLQAIKTAAREIYEKFSIKVIYFSYPNIKKNQELFTKKPSHGLYLHADELETSLVLYCDSTLVDTSKYKNEKLSIDPRVDYTPMRWTEFSKDYLIGDPSFSSCEKGKKFLTLTINDAKKIIDREIELIKTTNNQN